MLINHALQVFGLSQDPTLGTWGIPFLGLFGVKLFFIHTSLVLMMSLDRLARTAESITVRFYIRRAFRIYPLSVATVLIVTAAHIPTYFQPHYVWFGAKAFWANLLLIQNLFRVENIPAPLWSLPFEVQMYVLLPFLYYVVRKIRRNSLAATGIICLGVISWFLERKLARAAGYPALLEYAPWFSMGIAGYTMSRGVRSSLPSPAYVTGLLLFIASPFLLGRVTSDYRAPYAIWAAGVIFSVTLPYFRDMTNPVCRLTAHIIAKYSYGIYLSHVPILWLAFQKLAGLPLYARVMIFVSLIVAVPAMLYHSIEEPFIRMGSRISERIAQRTRAVEALAPA